MNDFGPTGGPSPARPPREGMEPADQGDKGLDSGWVVPGTGTMRRTGLVELEAAVAVARHRSFRSAAAELGMSATAISAVIRGLEARIGVRLFNRTSRSVALTSAGEAFVDRVAPSLAGIAEAIEVAQNKAGQPSGTLRINSSLTAGLEVLSPLVAGYLRLYPAMAVDIVTDSRLVDIVLDGCDAGIRLAGSIPADMIAVPLGYALDFSVVGSPDYLNRNAAPATPRDLLDHRCIRARWAGGGIYRWEFERDDEQFALDVPGALTLDDPSLILKAAISGLGLAYLADAMTREAAAAGELQYVLRDWKPKPAPLCLYYPRNRHTPASLRALIELIRTTPLSRPRHP